MKYAHKLAALLIAAFALFCFVAPQTAAAVDVLDPVCNNTTTPAAKGTAVCKDNQAGAKENPIFGPDGLVTTVIKWLSRIVGIASVVVIITAGIMLITSGGDSNNATTARRMITYASVGLVVALFAQAFVSFVLNKL